MLDNEVRSVWLKDNTVVDVYFGQLKPNRTVCILQHDANNNLVNALQQALEIPYEDLEDVANVLWEVAM